MEAGAVAKEKIAILKSREEKATEEELAEIKEEIKNLQKDSDAGDLEIFYIYIYHLCSIFYIRNRNGCKNFIQKFSLLSLLSLPMRL